MEKMSDRAIIEHLRSTVAADNEAAFEYLYGLLYIKVVGHIRKNNGSEEEARDIFQDALLAFYKLIRQERVPEDLKTEAYIFSICRNLWLKKLKKQKREVPLEEEAHDVPVLAEQLENLITTEKHEFLEEAIKALGPDCQAVLVAYYYEQLRMEEIREQLHFSSVQVAKNKKYKCMKKLKELVMNTDSFRKLF